MINLKVNSFCSLSFSGGGWIQESNGETTGFPRGLHFQDPNGIQSQFGDIRDIVLAEICFAQRGANVAQAPQVSLSTPLSPDIREIDSVVVAHDD